MAGISDLRFGDCHAHLLAPLATRFLSRFHELGYLLSDCDVFRRNSCLGDSLCTYRKHRRPCLLRSPSIIRYLDIRRIRSTRADCDGRLESWHISLYPDSICGHGDLARGICVPCGEERLSEAPLGCISPISFSCSRWSIPAGKRRRIEMLLCS